MTENASRSGARAPHGTPDAERAPMPRWKKVLLIVAGCLVVGGIALGLVGGGSSGQPGATPPGLGTAFVEPGPGEAGSEGGAASRISPGLTIMGFSFFVGFALGYALRAFLSIVLLVVGLVLLAITGLSYAELVTVHWDAMEGVFNGFAKRVETDFQAFSTAVTGRLPQAGLGGLGLFAGFKKR